MIYYKTSSDKQLTLKNIYKKFFFLIQTYQLSTSPDNSGKMEETISTGYIDDGFSVLRSISVNATAVDSRY